MGRRRRRSYDVTMDREYGAPNRRKPGHSPPAGAGSPSTTPSPKTAGAFGRRIGFRRTASPTLSPLRPAGPLASPPTGATPLASISKTFAAPGSVSSTSRRNMNMPRRYSAPATTKPTTIMSGMNASLGTVITNRAHTTHNRALIATGNSNRPRLNAPSLRPSRLRTTR